MSQRLHDVIAFTVMRISVSVFTIFVFWSRDLPNMVTTTKSEGNFQ